MDYIPIIYLIGFAISVIISCVAVRDENFGCIIVAPFCLASVVWPLILVGYIVWLPFGWLKERKRKFIDNDED